MLFALDHADVVAVEPGPRSQFLLGQATSTSQTAKIPGKHTPQRHAARAPQGLAARDPVY